MLPSSNRFLKFLFTKTKNKQQCLSLDHRDYHHSLIHVLLVHDTIFIFYLFIFIFFWGGGGIKITLLSNSISIINTKDRQKYIKSRKAIAQNEIINKTQQVRYNQLLHHAKFVHHSFFKWSL